MALPLSGRTIALAEGRQLEDLAKLLEKEGATILRCPMLSILDVTDAKPVNAWLRDLAAGKFDIVVLLTGEGLRRLIAFAERAGNKDAVIAALGKVTLVTRGPKPGQALKEISLKPSLVAAAPTTDGVITTLKRADLAGKTVGVQLYSESNPPLTDFLTAAGAKVKAVQPYVYAPAADADRVADLIRRAAGGAVDAIVFTSSPQVDRLFEVAADRQLDELWRRALDRVKVASVGPVVGATLKQKGTRVDIQPEQGFQMKNLVVHIKRAFEGT
jgi:uroporphyrinogen-III synthase